MSVLFDVLTCLPFLYFLKFILYFNLLGYVLLVFFAAINKTIGIKANYVKILLNIFEWGRSQSKSPRSPDGMIEKSGSLKKTAEHRHSICDEQFHFFDATLFVKAGIEAIVEDDVTQRFDAAELPAWNLLTRQNSRHQFINWKLTLLWAAGVIFRYSILPMRIAVSVTGLVNLILCSSFLGIMPSCRLKRILYEKTNIMSFRIFSMGFLTVIRYHDEENKAKPGGICVANHTSPIDVITLSCDNCYASVGQAQGGFLGLVQSTLHRASPQIWFDRSEIKDRAAVAQRLRDHVQDETRLPILIFPEGTCVNNTSVMMFKKGSFEVGGTVYPAAIKYDSRFADPFWNSQKFSMLQHLLYMITSWAIVCDVWYMEPEHSRPDETSVQFANRIKAKIAARGGLVDLDWDGMLKRSRPKPVMKEKQQEIYSQLIQARADCYQRKNPEKVPEGTENGANTGEDEEDEGVELTASGETES